MKLATKINRLYFRRELFTYMIPMILIVGSVDVFYHFVQCPLHPEWSAPCNINRILAAMYGVFLLFTIIFAIISGKALRKTKKQMEYEFTETINNHTEKQEIKKDEKDIKPRKIIAKKNNKSEAKQSISKKNSKKATTKRTSTKKSTAKK